MLPRYNSSAEFHINKLWRPADGTWLYLCHPWLTYTSSTYSVHGVASADRVRDHLTPALPIPGLLSTLLSATPISIRISIKNISGLRLQSCSLDCHSQDLWLEVLVSQLSTLIYVALSPIRNWSQLMVGEQRCSVREFHVSGAATCKHEIG